MSEIRIIEAPGVYLIGRQSVDEGELARFLADNGSPGWTTDAPSAGERLSEISGRLCYQSFKRPRPGGNKGYLDHILECGHGRVLEHAVWTLLLTGVSRSLAQELYTHSVGISKSMLSQRFVDEGDCAFVVPPALLDAVNAGRNWLAYSGQESATQSLRGLKPRDDGWVPAPYTTIEGAGLRWLAATEQAVRDYLYLSDWLSSRGVVAPSVDPTARRKAAREAARSVLPNCVETKICLTGNARAFRNLIETRGAAQADAEFRRLALALLPVLQHASPNLFADYETPTVDGVQRIQTPHRKV